MLWDYYLIAVAAVEQREFGVFPTPFGRDPVGRKPDGREVDAALVTRLGYPLPYVQVENGFGPGREEESPADALDSLP